MDLYAGHLLPCQILLHFHGNEFRHLFRLFDDGIDHLIFQSDEFLQSLEGGPHILRLFADHVDLKILDIHGQRNAKAIDDQAPRRADEAQIDAVLVGENLVAIALHDLKVSEAAAEKSPTHDLQAAHQ